jgi:FkbM family methyltransferase
MTGDQACRYICVPTSDLQLLIMLTDAPSGGLEPGTREVLRRILRPGMHMVDVGGNVGLHALAAARMVGRAGRVTGIEPLPSVVECLRQSIQLNALGAIVEIHATAVGSGRSTIRFFLHPVSGHDSLYQHPSDREGAWLSSHQGRRSCRSRRRGDANLLRLPGGALATHPHQQSARALLREIRRRTPVVGAFPDGQSALNLAAARLRHVAGTAWSSKRYLNGLLKDQQTRGAITG